MTPPSLISSEQYDRCKRLKMLEIHFWDLPLAGLSAGRRRVVDKLYGSWDPIHLPCRIFDGVAVAGAGKQSNKTENRYRKFWYFIPESILTLSPLTAKLFNLNFHPLEAVPRWRDPQLQVSENYSDLTKWRSTLFKYCWLMSHFIFKLFEMWYLIC